MNLTDFNFQKHRRKNKAMSQINVTPFVDVMLVLLIVFMITAPLLTVGVSVDLPKTKASQLNQTGDPLVLSIKRNGDLFIQERQISKSKLIPQLNMSVNLLHVYMMTKLLGKNIQFHIQIRLIE